MFAKILAVAALVAYAQAGVFELPQQHHHVASSYSSINNHVAPVSHYAAPALLKAAPIAAYHSAPVATYHSAPVATYHSAPALVKTAHVAPIAAYHAAPVSTYHAAPVVKAIHQEVYPDTHPQYSFQYGIQDVHTGDAKNQHEERDGDVVKGVYSLVQPDGVTRTVHYTSDAHNGFNAQVEYSGTPVVHKAVVAKAVIPTKSIVSAPIYNAYHH